ncbi:hypothetical protein [Curtobacterium sp. PhB115]|uniref:hypothetical protein n=1 Tax=Curtobacterium sp. PhB115 TaxID=2485173 RepID=UPI00161A1897|nr:hypothetical protein [Curtobacterium sp. PhB115]
MAIAEHRVLAVSPPRSPARERSFEPVGQIMQVSEVVALLLPMFRSMLRSDELASLRLEIVSRDDRQGAALEDDDLP